MNKKINMKILENADKKTLETLSAKYRAVDDKEAEKLFRRITDTAGDYYEEDQVQGVEISHRPVWRTVLSSAMTLVIAAGVIAGGARFYSQLKNNDTFDSNEQSGSTMSSTEKTFTPVVVTEDYKGEILGKEHWRMEVNSSDDYYHENIFGHISFIDTDMGYTFASSKCYRDEMCAYLADLNNDGQNELICNSVYGILEGDEYNYTQIYRLRNGVIEVGFFEDYESFAEENGFTISDHSDFSDRYDPKRNKFILTRKNDDKEYDLSIDRFTFYTMDPYPVRLDMDYGDAIPELERWDIGRHSVSSDTEDIYLIDKRTGGTLDLCTGYKDRTEVYFADLNRDGFVEVVCNYQYGESQDNMYDHVKIFRENPKEHIYIIECGEFLSDFEAFEEANGIELKSCDDFTEVYDPDRNKIILKKQGEDTEYEIGMEYYHFTDYTQQKSY